MVGGGGKFDPICPYGFRWAGRRLLASPPSPTIGTRTLGSTRSTRMSRASALGVVVVAFSFAGGGRPASCDGSLDLIASPFGTLVLTCGLGYVGAP